MSNLRYYIEYILSLHHHFLYWFTKV
jgi:hypothetical protein